MKTGSGFQSLANIQPGLGDIIGTDLSSLPDLLATRFPMAQLQRLARYLALNDAVKRLTKKEPLAAEILKETVRRMENNEGGIDITAIAGPPHKNAWPPGLKVDMFTLNTIAGNGKTGDEDGEVRDTPMGEGDTGDGEGPQG